MGLSQVRSSLTTCFTMRRAVVTSGVKSAGRLGGTSINPSMRLAIMHKVHKAPYCIGLVSIEGDTCGLERGSGSYVFSDPSGEDGFWLDETLAVLLRRGHDRLRRLGGRSERGGHVHD